MPPKKQPRCAYVERDHQCRRPGTGNPPLCEAHRIVLEEVAAQPPRPGEKLVGLLGRVFRGQKISDRQVHAGIEDLVGMFQQHPSYEDLRAQAEARLREEARRFQQRQQQRGPQQPPRPRKPAGPDPRVVLGFAAGQKVTADEVKKRHRELARKHHPDRGGSVARMQEINAAVDQLLASM
jgi:hypothetical protein